jgi:4-amino-4-deoxy-L-arabinose transferase
MGDVLSRKLKLIIPGLFLLFYILPLGFRPLFIPDESRYAEIPREMVASGDWIVPHLDGILYFEKPVLGYWLNAISIKMFGENAFAVRFPSAMATGVSAFIIFLLVRRFSNRNFLAAITAVIFLTCFEVYGVGTFNVLDSILAMFMTAAMASFFFAYTAGTSGKRKQGFLLLFGIFCGLAFLTKGFLAFAVPVIVIVPFMIWERRIKELFLMAWIPIACAVLVALPWGVLIHFREPDFWHYFFWNEHIKRFLSENAQHSQSFMYFFLVLPAAALPWAFLFPAAILGLKRTGFKSSMIRYAVCWFLFPFLFFSICKGKLLTYILPCFPPLAILISTGLDQYFETGGKSVFNAGGKSLALLIIGVAVALIGVQSFGFKGFKPYFQSWKWALSVAGLITFAYLLFVACRKTEYKKKIAFYAVSPIFIIFSTPFILPGVTLQIKTPGKILLQYSNLVHPDTILVSDENQVRAVCWFYKRNDVYVVGAAGELRYGFTYKDSKKRLLTIDGFNTLVKRNPGRIVAVFNFQQYQSWKEKLPKPLILKTNAIHTNGIIPKDGFVIATY